jgi:hypothetical protein
MCVPVTIKNNAVYIIFKPITAAYFEKRQYQKFASIEDN